jgi:hypothetical protein
VNNTAGFGLVVGDMISDFGYLAVGAANNPANQGRQGLHMPGFVPGGMSKDLHQTRVYGTIPLMGAAHRFSSSETTVMYSEESVPEGALIVMYRKETYFLYGNQTAGYDRAL